MSAFALADRWRGYLPRFRFAQTLETALAVLVIFLFSSALLSQLFGGGEEGSPILRLIWPPVYLLTLILIVMRPMPVLGLMVRAWPLMVLAVLPMVSACWSLDPGLTLRRGLGVVGHLPRQGVRPPREGTGAAQPLRNSPSYQFRGSF